MVQLEKKVEQENERMLKASQQLGEISKHFSCSLLNSEGK